MVNKQILQKSIIAQSKQFLSWCCSFKPAWTLLGKGLKPLSNVWFGQSCCYASSDKHSSNSENEAMLHLSYHLKFTSVLQVFEDCKVSHIILQFSANTGIWSEPNGFPYLQLSRVRGFLFSPLPCPTIYSSQWHYWNSDSNLYAVTDCPQMRH